MPDWGMTFPLSNLGDCHQESGQLEAARQAWRQALATLNDVGHTDAQNVQAKLDVMKDRHLP